MTVAQRFRSAFLADAPPGNTLARLDTSWDVRVTIHRLRNHKWRRGDLQYVAMVPLLLFCFTIVENPPFLARFALALALGTACLIPITSQFWLPFMPIGTYLFLFYSCGFIPAAWRPSIYVRVLPALETILYGGNLSEVLSSSTNSVLDILAWIPYGLGHFGCPFIVAAICFIFGPPSTLPVFAFAFGWMNVTGVMMQILFPAAPPWYLIEHGLAPANYSMPGSPGGLARIDKILGVNLYGGTFGASPMVFGAFPSLHSGSATMEVLFLCHLFPHLSPLFFGYEFWIWWSTMYLTHHYFIDLIGGACLSFTVFYIVQLTCLPRIQKGKFGRWSYDYIETGISKLPVKVRKSIDDGEFIELPSLDTISAPPDDELPISAPVPYRPVPKPLSDLYHNHHKTSSFHLYEGDLRATSASSPVSSMRQEYAIGPQSINTGTPASSAPVNTSSIPSSASASSANSVTHAKSSSTPSPRSDDSLFSNIFSRSMSPIHRD